MLKRTLKSLAMHRVTLCFLLGCLCQSGLGRRDHCPEVKPLKHFNIFAVLGQWNVVQYYSSSEESLTYHCMRMEFGLSNGNMDMKMRFIYKYVADPTEEVQTGNITWQIPDPMRPEHWRHTEDHYKGVYSTDVVDTDHSSWLILMHCSDPESEKKFLSTFVLSRMPYMDKGTMDYLREKVGTYDVNLEYLFPVNQTSCYGDEYPHPEPKLITTTTPRPVDTEDEQDGDIYFAEDSAVINNKEEQEELEENLEEGLTSMNLDEDETFPRFSPLKTDSED